MRIALLYGAPATDAGPDEHDVLVQLAAVRAALQALDHTCIDYALGADLAVARDWLQHTRPDLIFNLVESIDGDADRIHEAPELFAQLNIPFTGCDAEALLVTSHKLLCKERLLRDDLPTPAWSFDARQLRASGEPGPWIVKPIAEDASVGIDDAAVCDSARAAADRLESCQRAGGQWFAERYIDGREVNVSLLANGAAVEVLPPAEIVFRDYAPDKPRIVGYAAKWLPESFEYHHTPRDFEQLAREPALCAELERIAARCWSLFELRGYARVDCRIDPCGDVWILEINANPCLSPDAGFAAAVERRGLNYATAIAHIVAAALR